MKRAHPVVHHTKRIFRATPKFVHGAIAGALVGLLLVAVLRTNAPVTAADCDSNAVIWCGVTSGSNLYTTYHKNGGDGHNSSASIQSIYSWFKMNSTVISEMRTSAQTGYVTSSGLVYLSNGTEVGKNALTAGRSWISGSTTEKVGSTTFYVRKPSVSFKQSKLAALILMKNGVFQHAVLESCGNPVNATPTTSPPKKPSYSIQKQVRIPGNNSWSGSVSTLSDTTVQYRITVRSTGAVAARNIKVTDRLPSGVSYKNGLNRNGVAVNPSNFFGTKGDIISLNPGASATYTFNAVVGPKDVPANCSPKMLTNTAFISASGLPNENSSAKVNEECAANPNYSCTNMSVIQLSTTNFSFTTNASVANGAKIVSYNYDFGDGTTKTVNSSAKSNSITHNYAKLGTYNVAVSLAINLNGKLVTSNMCQTTVTPSTTVVTTSKITSLPNTGPGAVILIAILSIVGGYATHHAHRHIQRKRRAAHRSA